MYTATEFCLGLGFSASNELSFAVTSIKITLADIPRSIGWEAFAQLGRPTNALGIANSALLHKTQEDTANLLPNFSRLDISAINPVPSSPLWWDLPQKVQDQVVDAVVRLSNKYVLLLICSPGGGW
ncbi:hypothetical protein BJ170DRAFT_678897 [Xylariales sp. AK1849]|nr:hypothetical protein BJ170DRAFT_678897 [Xylariales sp. AK1849]